MVQTSMARGSIAGLVACGAAAFWLSNFVISLTPVAGDYRAALSIAYFPMLVEALVGGLVLALCVALSLVHSYDRIPTGNAVSKAVVLSGMAFVVLTVAVEVPAKFGSGISDAGYYFLVAAAINLLRILALGLAIGGLYALRVTGPASTS